MFDPNTGRYLLPQGSAVQDPTTKVWYGQPTVTPTANTPIAARNVPGTALWNGVGGLVVGGTSSALTLATASPTYKSLRVYLSVSTGAGIQTVVAGIQFSFDGGTSWYNYTQDNSGTPWLISAVSVAGNPVLVCRDVPVTLCPTQVRLIATTITLLTGNVTGTVEYGG